MELFNGLKYIFEILKKKDFYSFIFLIFILILTSILDVVGIASIIPFIYSIVNTETLLDNNLLNYFYHLFDFSDINRFQIFIFLSFSCLIIFSILFRSISVYIQYRFALLKEYSISKRLLKNYINQDYLWFTNQNSSKLIKNLISEVSTVVNTGIVHYTNAISQSFIIIGIVVLLLFVNFKVSFFSSIFLVTAYLITLKFFGSYLKNYGIKRFDYNENRFFILDQIFNTIREIKIFNLSNNYSNNFNSENLKYVKTNLISSVIAVIPKYLFELIVFFILLFFVFVIVDKNYNFIEFIPLISLYLFACYRLMPAFQSLYNSLSKLKFADKSIKSLHKEIIKSNKNDVFETKYISKEGVHFRQNISFEKVKFKYPSSDKENIKNISVEFIKGSKNGIAGDTGSGKTTFLNLLIGLFKPSEGEILIDGKVLNTSNLNSFREIIGYAAQNTILIDDSIAANIALSDKYKEINYEKLKEASDKAEILEFIIKDLPSGFDTRVGQDGIKLSGGQRQRIGIARALYNNPDIIFFDEATNALDKLTEMKVFKNILEKKDITLFCISHDVNLFKNFDSIIVFENGQIRSKGNYEQLINRDKLFKTKNS